MCVVRVVLVWGGSRLRTQEGVRIYISYSKESVNDQLHKSLFWFDITHILYKKKIRFEDLGINMNDLRGVVYMCLYVFCKA